MRHAGTLVAGPDQAAKIAGRGIGSDPVHDLVGHMPPSCVRMLPGHAISEAGAMRPGLHVASPDPPASQPQTLLRMYPPRLQTVTQYGVRSTRECTEPMRIEKRTERRNYSTYATTEYLQYRR